MLTAMSVTSPVSMSVMPMLALSPTTMTGLAVTVAVQQLDLRADPGAKDLGVPLRGRAFRFNLASLNFRCNP